MDATAFLLAAGLGTRLRPLTSHRPKPLLPVCGRPLLDEALARLRAAGHTRIVVNAHHLWPQIAAWADANGVALQVELPDILGTGGGLRAARAQLAARVVIVNGDILVDADLRALAAAVPAGGAAMLLREDPALSREAPVEADASGTITRMRDFAGAPGRGRPGTHFTGIHACDTALLDRVPPGEACILRTAYREVVPAGLVKSVLHAGSWVDIGTPAEYLRANLDALDGALPLALDPWARAPRRPDGAWVSPDATVHGRLSRSVVGAGARVPAGATLHDCVVWDGESVPAGDHRRCVFFGGGERLEIPEG